jgi:hypothetical protein
MRGGAAGECKLTATKKQSNPFGNGTVTDGFSHNILKNTTVQVIAGTQRQQVVGNRQRRQLRNHRIVGGQCTLSAAITGYQTTTQQVTISGNSRVGLVLPRHVIFYCF